LLPYTTLFRSTPSNTSGGEFVAGHNLDCRACESFGRSGGRNRLRTARVSHLRRQAARLAKAFSRPHHKTVRKAWNQKCCLLDSNGRACKIEYSDLHSGASEP